MTLADDLARRQAPARRKAMVGRIAELLERAGLDADDLGAIERVKAYQGFYKDAEGEAHTVDMLGVSLHPSWADGPQWPVVQPAKPTVVRAPQKRNSRSTDERRTLLLPDPQIGYYRNAEGALQSMHDETAMRCAVSALALVAPDRVVNLGDFLDFPEWSSKFLVLPEFVLTTQPALDRAHRFLAEQRAATDAPIQLLAGNHDDRLPNAIARNAMAAMRLRRANTPDDWPVMSVPHLLRLDELGVEYVDGYPAGKTKLAAHKPGLTPLFAHHGTRLDMLKQARSTRQSYVQGHTHHFSMHAETYEVDGKGEEVQAWSLGCLSRCDGAVPSTKGAYTGHSKHVPVVESWQQGFAVLCEVDDAWWLEPVRIRSGVAHWRGHVIRGV